jgi:DNA repair exonuclease SbcCD nuclease subunit
VPDQTVRLLLLADTHLGFDLPLRPRVERPRRGLDFFANTRRALAPALRGEVDLVVHGGDLLYRSRVSAGLQEMALEPLLEVADAGVPLVLVPGNHERSDLPYPLLAAHADLHVLHRPCTIELELAGIRVAVSGFPCVRDDVRGRFASLLGETGWHRATGDIRLLCIHQTVEGATVGPRDYRFSSGHDVIRGRDIPDQFAAVLAGHIHRHQMLSHDLEGRALAAPVLYPGSVERTSAAERDEPKGWLTLELAPRSSAGGSIVSWRFHPLPTRPLIDLVLTGPDLDSPDPERLLEAQLASLQPNAVVRIRTPAFVPWRWRDVLRAATLRTLASPDMIVTVRPARRDRLE